MQNSIYDKVSGCLLGLAIGDTLGMPFEGYRNITKEDIMFFKGRYTDDTQMMIGIIETLIEKNGFDPAYCAQRFVENFEPYRGYGGRIYGIMDKLRKGYRWDEVGTDSFGNGCCMRIAPIGLFYANDINALIENARLSSIITHKDKEAVWAAILFAYAVSVSFKMALNKQKIEKQKFIQTICKPFDKTKIVKELEKYKNLNTDDISKNISRVYGCGVMAIKSVPCAIYSFLHSKDFEQAVTNAILCGGDTDTVGAMTGALAGSFYGISNIPEKYINILEESDKGKSYILNLSKKLSLLIEKKLES